MTPSTETVPQQVPRAERIPALRNGDRLTRDEFERRYTAMPDVKKAELIEGVVYMPSPVSRDHAEPHFDLIGWLSVYSTATPGVKGGDNGTLRLDLDNEPQPDAYLRILETHGGQSDVDEDGYIAGAPELVAEVAVSSVSIDLHDKLNAYRRNGVKEYVVWRVEDEAIDWFILRRGRFVPLPPDAEGLCRGAVLPGLWLAPEALLGGDLARVSQVLRQGLDSAEHADFVAKLQRKAAGKKS